MGTLRHGQSVKFCPQSNGRTLERSNPANTTGTCDRLQIDETRQFSLKPGSSILFVARPSGIPMKRPSQLECSRQLTFQS